MNNSKRINNSPRETIISNHDCIERPTKRQKSETGSENVDIANVLSDIGIANYKRGDYHAAEECFSQALCRVNDDYYLSSSFEGMKAMKSTSRKKTLQSLMEEIFSTTDIVAIIDNNKIYEDVDKIKEIKEENKQIHYIQDEIPIPRQQREVKYDEGMRKFQNLLQIEKVASIEELSAIFCYNIGQTYVQRKRHNDAIVWFHKSLDKFLSTNRNLKFISIVANLHSLAYCLYRIGHDEDAKKFYQRALDIILEHNLDGTHLAASYNCLGVILFNKHHQSSDSGLAMEMFLKSLDLYKSYQSNKNANKYDDVLMIREIATVLNNIGRVHYLQSNFEKALTIYKECMQLRQICLACDSVDIAATAYNLGQTSYRLNHVDDALSYYHQFLNITTSVEGFTFKDNALVYKGIAEIHYGKANFKTSLHYYNQALQILKIHSNNGRPNQEIAAILNKMGNLCYEMKNNGIAMRYYQQGLKIENALFEPNHPNIIVTVANIGHIHKQLGQYRHALSAYQQVYKMQQAHYGLDSFVLAETLSSIGLMQYHLKKYESSFESYQEALRIRRQHLGTDDHPDIASTLNSIGLVLFWRDKHDLARKCFEESLRIRIKLLGKDHPNIAILWYNLATIHFETGEDELAIQMYKETLRVERHALGNEHPNVVLTLQHLGQIHQQLGLAENAIEYFNEALHIERNRKFEGRNNNQDAKKANLRSLARILNLLGNIYLQLGRTSKMMECYIESSRIYESNRLFGETVVIGGYNFYGLSKTNVPCAPVA